MRVRNSKNISHAYRKSFQRKDSTGKGKERRRSTFIKIVCKNPNKTKKTIVPSAFGGSGYKAPVYDTYAVEFDMHAGSEPHIHLWNASNNGNRMSDTRSQGISLNSSFGRDIEYTEQEFNNEKQLNDVKREQMLDFVEENRYLLFLMYNAFMMKKTKSFVGMDEDSMYSLFTKAELDSLNQKYNLYLNSKKSPQFGE